MSVDGLSGRNGGGSATAVSTPRSSSPLSQLAERLPRSRRQRRPGMLAAGVVVIAGCAAVAAGLAARAEHAVAVLAVARPVAAGQTVAAADLRVARISGSGLSAMSASALLTVVGETATSSLTPGTLLESSMLSRQSVPAPGAQLVAVALKSTQVPAGVAAGRLVSLVLTGSAGGRGPSGAGAVLVTSAPVVALSGNASGDVLVLSVQVPGGVAPMVAQAAAAGTLAVTLLPVMP